ncbi:MAG TPA: hypothetical protein VMW10_05415 [Alphaproteobacteria bacterium]|nr:hypothetical protein [Alphaproteobacteria bacterium]
MEFYVEFRRKVFEKNKENWDEYLEDLIPSGAVKINSKVSRFCFFECEEDDVDDFVDNVESTGASWREN